MEPERWQHVARIYDSVIDRTEADRSMALAEACGDDVDLRSDVESLLSQDAEPFVIDRPAWEAGARLLGQDIRLGSGALLAHYRIGELLGSGGMGDVYRARDTKLHRDVALKILPEAFAYDPERRARFDREAQILASINHPNIGAIYGLEDGVITGEHDIPGIGRTVQALVLELVEGPTLADRIAQGPRPVDEALTIARQIADALEAAHEYGIVHRDLKPSNIKVRPDGTVKVLDFGLAKPRDPGETERDTSDAVITSPAMTAAGMLLGTAAYMSPEQARGLAVDKRSDVWAFGSVLYEMLTGKRAFDGSDVAETIAAVLRAEPDWAALPPNAPQPLRTLLRRCLEKNPKRRLRDIADARLELEDAALGNPLDTMGRERLRSLRRRSMLAAAATLVAVVAVFWGWRRGASTPRAPEMRLEISTPPTSDPLSLDVSPDGQRVAFVATSEGRPMLWLRRLAEVQARPLPGTDFAAHPFWSPDGRSIGFFSDARLKRIDVDSGRVELLAAIEIGLGGTWTPDGGILFSTCSACTIVRVPELGGVPVPVTRLQSGQLGHRFPQMLPDGRHFIYYVAGTSEANGVYVAQVDGSNARRLFASDSAAVYVSGHLLFVRQGTLYAQPFKTSSFSTTGSPLAIVQGVAVDTGFGRPALAASLGGVFLYRSTAAARLRQFIWFDRKGLEIARIGEPEDAGPSQPAGSPDGRRVAMIRAVGGNLDVWLLDVARGTLDRVTSSPSTENLPIWSPDGQQLLFGSTRRGNNTLEIFLKEISEAADEKLFAPTPNGLTTFFPSDWSHDGRFILAEGLDARTGWDIWALPQDGTKKPFPVVQTPFSDRSPQFSPDGKWMCYVSNDSGRWELYVQPFPRGPRTRISTAGGVQPRWRSDGSELFYIALDGRLMVVSIQQASDGTFQAGVPAPLFETRIRSSLPGQGINTRPQYIVSRDGQRFLVHTFVKEDTSPIVAILNWNPEP